MADARSDFLKLDISNRSFNMKNEEWARTRDLLDRALDQPPPQRDAFLLSQCDGNESQLRDVRLLLEAYDTADHDFFEDGAAVAAGLADPSVDVSGRKVGEYRLVRQLGQGGMGVVYLAERADGSYRRRVAIKMLPPYFNTPALLRRFRAERQILAGLQHPGIAQFYHGGVTDGDQPYLVMEYVEGEPITSYCARMDLNVKQRLDLFESICSAVGHAHHKLIVHRDLKPSNILVNGAGEVKLLDFGVAKLLDGSSMEATTVTQTGQQRMTPAYAAPEQVRGEQVTMATDVYALGAMLYELLSGRRPYDLKGCTPASIERIVCEVIPVPPSAATPSVAGSKAQNRRRKELRKDLDTIVLKALRKEPESRFSSVAEFVADVQRCRRGFPIKSRKAGWGYRTRKFLSRHPWQVATAATILPALLVLTTFYLIQLQSERDYAQRQALRAEVVSGFLVNLFEANDPFEVSSDSLTLRSLLDRGMYRVEDELKLQPKVQAQMADVMGRIYMSLGRFDQAEVLLERALQLKNRHFGSGSPETAATLYHVGRLNRRQGDFPLAERMYRRALAIQRRSAAGLQPDAVRTQSHLASLLRRMGEYKNAEILFREVLEKRRALLGRKHVLTANTVNRLAVVVHNQGDLNNAESLYRDALKVRLELLGRDHPDVAASLNNLGSLLVNKKEYVEAKRLFRMSLRIRRQVFGSRHPTVALTLNNLALALREQGDITVAEPLFRRALTMRRDLLGADHPDVGVSEYTLAGLLLDQGQLDEAEAHFREALSIFRASIPRGHSLIGRTLLGLGRSFMERKQPARAEAFLRKGLNIQVGALGSEHWEVAESRLLLAECLRQMRRTSEPRALVAASE